MMDYCEAEKLFNSNDIPDTATAMSMLETFYKAAEVYRAEVERLNKKIQLYRDVASNPDIHIHNKNKDHYNNKSDAYQAFREEFPNGNEEQFIDWLFAEENEEEKKV